MSFIITDLDSSEVFDIVENRQLPFLIKYFSKFNKNARRSVKTIVINMYKPYITLIKKLLPNAKIIFDRFHIVNNLSRAFNKTRIEVMKKLPTSSTDYKRLKRYWKLFQKKFSELDADNYNRFVHFKDLISQAGVVHKSMEIDKSLEDTYEIYQILLNDI
ncbi:transposase, partial [Helcococcus bovis]|uniref:transposase n=1 Tax=Helcococcus bovis TaxID=3153252 RepID=UPI0038BDC5C0